MITFAGLVMMEAMQLYFIGLEERIMVDLASALGEQGHTVTTFPAKVAPSVDQVIVGRQVQAGHPALQAAQRLGLPLCAYPSYLREYAQDKQRIVIMGGEESALLCALVRHVLAGLCKDFDYVLDCAGQATAVKLSEAPTIIFSGDVAPSSAIDPLPQCLHYQHHTVLISSVCWPGGKLSLTSQHYLQCLADLAAASPKGGTLVYCEEAGLIKAIGNRLRADVHKVPYRAHTHRQEGTQVYLAAPQGEVPFPQGGVAAMQAVAGAQQLLYSLAVTEQQFYRALASFSLD